VKLSKLLQKSVEEMDYYCNTYGVRISTTTLSSVKNVKNYSHEYSPVINIMPQAFGWLLPDLRVCFWDDAGLNWAVLTEMPKEGEFKIYPLEYMKKKKETI